MPIIKDLQSAYPDSATLAEILDDSTAVQDRFTERTKVKIQLKEVGGKEMVTVMVQEKERISRRERKDLVRNPDGESFS